MTAQELAEFISTVPSHQYEHWDPRKPVVQATANRLHELMQVQGVLLPYNCKPTDCGAVEVKYYGDHGVAEIIVQPSGLQAYWNDRGGNHHEEDIEAPRVVEILSAIQAWKKDGLPE